MYYKENPTNQALESLSTKRILWSQFWAHEAAEARESPSWNDHLTAPALLFSLTVGMGLTAFCNSSWSKWA